MDNNRNDINIIVRAFVVMLSVIAVAVFVAHELFKRGMR